MFKHYKKFWLLLILAGLFQPLYAESDSGLSFSDLDQQSKWSPPPPVDEGDRVVKFELQAAFRQDADTRNQGFSMLDISAKRQLDENSVFGEALLRFSKNLSIADSTDRIDLRLARLSYLEPWLQVVGGRFDLFQIISPNLFFGGYPLMGVHRVDGVMATIPFSFFLDFGPAKQGQAQASSPLALSFFYTPSLFSAQQVQYDNTQTFWLASLRFKLESEEFNTSLQVHFGGSANDFFDYSSLNGGYTASISSELAYRQNYSLTAEYGVQNIAHFQETSALALGFQASRIGTWGAFSLDQMVLEGQFPLGSSPFNPFTGGNGFFPAVAQAPQPSGYFKIRARLKVLFMELHVTNNQNDFTMARPASNALAAPFMGAFGPGNETDGPGTPLRSASYNQLAYMVRMGVEF